MSDVCMTPVNECTCRAMGPEPHVYGKGCVTEPDPENVQNDD